MRIVLAVGLLIFASSAWADALKVKIKIDDDGGDQYAVSYGHDRVRHYDKRYDRHHNKRYDKGDKSRHRQHGHNRYNLWYGWDRDYYGYSTNRYGNQYHRPRYWVKADQFRTRTKHRSDPVILINASVSAIGLTGLKRHASIYEVWAELGNGRRIPLRALEGSLYYGTSHTKYFDKPRYVKRLHLRVGPEYRHHRAYVSVDYLPGKGRKRHSD